MRSDVAESAPENIYTLTFTLPDGLRQIARSHQKLIYNLLFRTSAAATQQLAGDTRFVGGQIGLVGVLQTWARDLTYHPHVHFLGPGGGLSANDQAWLSAGQNFLIPVKALSSLFRAKFRAALRKTDLFAQAPAGVWKQVGCHFADPASEQDTPVERQSIPEMTCPACGQVMQRLHTLRPRSRCPPADMPA